MTVTCPRARPTKFNDVKDGPINCKCASFY